MRIEQSWSASSSDVGGDLEEDLASLAQGWSSPLCVSVVLPGGVYAGPVEVHVVDSGEET